MRLFPLIFVRIKQNSLMFLVQQKNIRSFFCSSVVIRLLLEYTIFNNTDGGR